MKCINIENGFDEINNQYMFMFTLTSMENAEKARANLLPLIRNNISFTIDVIASGYQVIIKYSDSNYSSRIYDFCRLLIEKYDDAL